jgi:hypothetical protein
MSLAFEWDAEKAASNREKHGVSLVRGKYAGHYAQGSNVVVLSPDVAQAFPNAEAVNKALRALMEIAQQNVAPSQ